MTESRTGNIELFERLRDVTSFLDSHQFEHALVGGLAVTIWGEPRTTYDIDFAVASEPEQWARLQNKIESAPLFPLGTEVLEMSRLSILRTHLLTADGKDVIVVDFLQLAPEFARSLLSRRVRVAVAGQEMSVVTPEDLMLLKLVSGRQKDLEDLRGVRREQAGTLDLNYMEVWAENLGCLNQARAEKLLPGVGDD